MTHAIRACLAAFLLLAPAAVHGDLAPAPEPARRVVVFASDSDFYPYEWLDESGKPHGFNVDLMRALGAVLDLDIQVKLTRWDDARKMLEQDGTAHVSDMYFSEERARKVDFADPFAVVWERAWIRKGDRPVKVLDDVKGRRVVVQQGGFTEDFLRRWSPETPVIPVASESTALRELARGHGDVALVTQVSGREAERLGIEGIEPSGPPMLPRGYGLVVRKGDAALLDDLNRGLSALRQNGEFERLERHWLATPGGTSDLAIWLDRYLKWILLGAMLVLAAGLLATLLLGKKVRRQARDLAGELSERRRTEEALRQSREQFHIAFHASPVVQAISRLEDGKYIDVNAAFERVTGWKREEVLGRTSIELNLWVQPTERERVLQGLVRRSSVHKKELQVRRKTGEIIDTLFDGHRVVLAGEPCLLSSLVDISERKHFERALSESEERWKFALEGAGDGVWDWDVQAGQVFVSRRYKEILGYPEDAPAQDMLWEHRVHPEDWPRAAEDFRAYVRRAGGLFECEARLACLDGSHRWTLIRGQARGWDANGRPLRMIGTITDVTDRHEAQEERASLEAQLQQAQKMETVGQLAGGIAHDFNNQLMVVRGYCELLQEQPLDDRSRNLLAEVVRATDRAAALTGRLLAFGRKQVRRLSVLNVNKVLSEMSGALSMMAGDSIRVVVDGAPNLGNVRADRDQVEQVIANLVVNARDAMQGGGQLTIRTRNLVLDDAYARHHVGASAGPCVVLTFQDTGVGIDPETQARIFEPFFTTKKEGQGSGLGLSIVYGIVKQSGGHVTVESEPGRGATFRVYLPRVEETAVSSHDTPEAPVAAQRVATVLFVEDDPNLFSLLRGVLERAGFKTLAASDPEAALALAHDHPGRIDVLVSDVMMPGKSGPAVAEELRQARPDIRVLFISGYPKDVLDRHTVLPADVRLLRKPFSGRELVAAIEGVLEGIAHPEPASPDA